MIAHPPLKNQDNVARTLCVGGVEARLRPPDLMESG